MKIISTLSALTISAGLLVAACQVGESWANSTEPAPTHKGEGRREQQKRLKPSKCTDCPAKPKPPQPDPKPFVPSNNGGGPDTSNGSGTR